MGKFGHYECAQITLNQLFGKKSHKQGLCTQN